jgi:hypothetical protein
MKRYFLIVIFLFFYSSALCKERNLSKISMNAGIGLPSIIRSYIKIRTENYSPKVKGLGPFILKIDYQISSRLSLGLNGMYNFTKVNWLTDGYGPAPYFEKQKFESGIEGKEYSLTSRLNYHFWKQKKTSFYGGLGIGYGLTNAKSFSKAPNPPFIIDIDFPSPLRFDATVGIRYFPIKHVGLYSELGLGKIWILLKKYFIPESLFQIGFIVK